MHGHCTFLPAALWIVIGFPAVSAQQLVYHLTTVAGSDLVGDGGTAVAAQLAQPEGIAVGPGGDIYIADAANHRVRQVTPDGLVLTVAGNGHAGFSGDDGPAVSAQLSQPYGLAMDPAGNLYIADYGNGRVRRIAPDGTITTLTAGLMGPRNLALDAAGNLYVSEFDGHRVQRVSPEGATGLVAGTGIAGFSGDGGPAYAAQLAFPAGLAIDTAGNLYIADTGNVRIRKVPAGGGAMQTVCSPRNFDQPYVQFSGLALDAAGNLVIADSGNALVWRLTPAGVLTRVAGTPAGDAYSGNGRPALETALIAPVDAAVDAAGNLYLSEARRVRRVAAATGLVDTIAGSGEFGFGGDLGSAGDAVLNSPMGLALNHGSLFIADRDNQRVRQVSADGVISTAAGSGARNASGDGLTATAAGLNLPAAVAFDPAGNLFIADTFNQRVRRVDPTGVITTVAGNGTVNGYGGDGNPATLTPLNAPQGVAVDPAGLVYVADTNHHRILRLDGAGTVLTVAGTGTPGDLYGPSGLAFDQAGKLYIADTLNHRVRVLDPDGTLYTVAGTGSPGFSGDAGAATAAQLGFPAAVAVDRSGNLYIADTGNHRVRMVTPNGAIATIAGTGDATFNGDDGSALEMALSNPAGLAVDDTGAVWVADTGNQRVRILTPAQVVTPPPQLVDISIASAASLQEGPLAPGEIFSIFGQGIGPSTPATGSYDSAGMLSTALGGVQVLIDGTAAPLFYAGAQQINAQAPYDIAGRAMVQLQVMFDGLMVASKTVPVAEANPALFTLNYGSGNAVAVNQDGSINSSEHPAPRGSVVILYATGEGATSPAGVTGQGAGAPYPLPVLPVSLLVGDVPVNIWFAGDAPGFVGLMQINAEVPGGFLPSGNQPLVLRVGPYQSPAGVTIAIE